MSILAGNANPELSQRIARKLGVPLGKVQVGRFSDGEINVEIMENIRGRDVFLIQSTCPPVNDNLMEMLIMADACRRASAASITAVIPYFGYARQDRRPRAARVPITAQMVASMIGTSGINRVLTIDLHADQIQGFFPIPVDNVYASPVLLGDAWKQERSNMVVVSPDVGGVVRARALAKRLDDADLAIIDKRRPRANELKIMNIIGDVKGKTCIMIDDMVDTAGTLCQAADFVKNEGATRVVAYITHPVLSGPAIERINASQLDELVVTDTIPLTEEAQKSSKIRQLGVAELLGETMRRIAMNESVSSLYVD
ncbi:MAG: ribose-phosphate diphosphokinase [Gammaproteobacteria bacterium]|nr:ribose-phosphate diphosphokinase [Gammaproteobacteria bacterium]MCP4089540.1 ribose-phosphate diphosphokinase [Gammaproteobacteria bacterium]MCP4276246.1 ribose-phosphate diphosphokinase [Gammaproteobacteria bacterium]MCP4832943.1 ribose-phosphate diphosphokinase [Gammaproteobacteria bacterium]MCP4930068.1 ribose-phosphate diphosphokinase [Gammaproteobacteria bacterium]